MLQGFWKQHLRPRAAVGYGVKIFLPSPPNYVTRSPGMHRSFSTLLAHKPRLKQTVKTAIQCLRVRIKYSLPLVRGIDVLFSFFFKKQHFTRDKNNNERLYVSSSERLFKLKSQEVVFSVITGSSSKEHVDDSEIVIRKYNLAFLLSFLNYSIINKSLYSQNVF